jgi:hypothetical protein
MFAPVFYSQGALREAPLQQFFLLVDLQRRWKVLLRGFDPSLVASDGTLKLHLLLFFPFPIGLWSWRAVTKIVEKVSKQQTKEKKRKNHDDH